MYLFQSRATPDLHMLDAHGRWMLELIGKVAPHSDASAASRGILLPADMPVAIARLEQAIAQSQSEELAQESIDDEAENADDALAAVGLHQRARPFLSMLRAALEADTPVVWGV